VGSKLVIADFSESLLEHVTLVLSADGYDIEPIIVDVANRKSVIALAAASAALGQVTQVVHTAGLSPAQATAEAIFTVDLAGVAFVLDEFGAVIAPGGAGVVIASMAGAMAVGRFPVELEAALAATPSEQLASLPFWSDPSFADPGTAYSIAKRGNQLRVQVASASWGARGARINSVSPGVVSTPMGRKELDSASGKQMRAMIDASGTKRVGTPADIAGAVAFLLGPDASFITGTDLLVDGGVVAAIRSGVLSLG
jgi:NAD(P)-dependent dehydrogenase (short-subunit alcohol dehydrogenase family)